MRYNINRTKKESHDRLVIPYFFTYYTKFLLDTHMFLEKKIEYNKSKIYYGQIPNIRNPVRMHIIIVKKEYVNEIRNSIEQILDINIEKQENKNLNIVWSNCDYWFTFIGTHGIIPKPMSLKDGIVIRNKIIKVINNDN